MSKIRVTFGYEFDEEEEIEQFVDDGRERHLLVNNLDSALRAEFEDYIMSFAHHTDPDWSELTYE